MSGMTHCLIFIHMEPVKKDLAICGSFFGPKKACPDFFIFFRDPEIRKSDFFRDPEMGMS